MISFSEFVQEKHLQEGTYTLSKAFQTYMALARGLNVKKTQNTAVSEILMFCTAQKPFLTGKLLQLTQHYLDSLAEYKH